MAELKTKPTNQTVEDFLNSITSEPKRKDGLTLLEIFKKATGEKPIMWGASIVGFGCYHYKSERSSQEGDWPLVAFSPRKQNLSLYIIHGGKEKFDRFLQRLGKHKISVGCLYINKLADVDQDVLFELIKTCYTENKKKLT